MARKTLRTVFMIVKGACCAHSGRQCGECGRGKLDHGKLGSEKSNPSSGKVRDNRPIVKIMISEWEMG